MGKKYTPRPKLKDRYGVCDVTIGRWIKSGRLPDPLLIHGRQYFDETELDEKDQEAKAAFQRAQAEPARHVPPQPQAAVAPRRPRGRPRKVPATTEQD